MNNLYIGTSGIVVPVPQTQYPEAFREKSRLCYYSSLLNSLEINSSFYKNPKSTTIAKWNLETGKDFRFTFKISKAISHAKDLAFDAAAVDEFMALMNGISNKKGCLLLQLPPKTSIDSFIQLQKLLLQIHSNDTAKEWRIAVEFRHSSWYIAEVEELFAEYNACRVIHDIPKSATPIKVTGDLFYLRFHGEEGRYRGSYDEVVLKRYASIIKEWLTAGKTGYCYFNNTMGDAFANARTLISLVNK
jgi:uncharacterized protein YecE (DUF72 family)